MGASLVQLLEFSPDTTFAFSGNAREADLVRHESTVRVPDDWCQSACRDTVRQSASAAAVWQSDIDETPRVELRRRPTIIVHKDGQSLAFRLL